MRSCIHIRVLAVTASFCAFSPAAHAADADSGDLRREAVRLTTQAADAYKDGRFSDALKLFDAAYGTYPAPPLLLNLSRTELKLGQCEEAFRYARMFARTASGAATPDSPQAWLHSLNEECPQVQVTTIPGGASIRIAGAPQVEGSVTPWKGRLTPGRYDVILRRTGYTDLHELLDVVRGAAVNRLFELVPVEAPPAATEQSKPPPAPAKVVLTAQPPASVDVPPPVTRPRLPILRAVGWTGVAVGAAALVTAIVLGVTVNNDKVALMKPSSTRTTAGVDSELSSIQSRAVGSDVLFGIGGAAGIVGASFVIAF